MNKLCNCDAFTCDSIRTTCYMDMNCVGWLVYLQQYSFGGSIECKGYMYSSLLRCEISIYLLGIYYFVWYSSLASTLVMWAHIILIPFFLYLDRASGFFWEVSTCLFCRTLETSLLYYFCSIWQSKTNKTCTFFHTFIFNKSLYTSLYTWHQILRKVT